MLHSVIQAEDHSMITMYKTIISSYKQTDVIVSPWHSYSYKFQLHIAHCSHSHDLHWNGRGSPETQSTGKVRFGRGNGKMALAS